MSSTEDFYLLERKHSTLEENIRVVVVMGGKSHGLCLGSGTWTTAILLPEGKVVEGVAMQIRKSQKEETVMLGKEAGEKYAGFLDDQKLAELRFLIRLSKN